MKTIVIIPSRMASQRFPNKPMAKINGIPMIERVWRQAVKSNIGDVYVACCDKKVFEFVSNIGGNAIMTDPNLPSGTDRVYAAFKILDKYKNLDSIINLQGDMPLIRSEEIHKVNQIILKGYEIGTLATNLSYSEEKDLNITKVKIKWKQEKNIGEAIDFYKKPRNLIDQIYHHVGIYSFKLSSLDSFVKLTQSKNEKSYNLEQWRALDAGIKIGISFLENVSLSVDTIDDLIKVENIIKKLDDKN